VWKRKHVFSLMFMGPYIVSIFQYISHKMQSYTVYSYLETALHVSGGTSTHHQERIKLYLQHLVFVTPLLLPAVIVEELFQPFHDKGDILEHVFSLGVTKTRLIQPVENFGNRFRLCLWITSVPTSVPLHNNS
jgi:hypothetical protein